MVGTGTAAPAPELLCPHSRLPEPLSTVRANPHKIEGSGQRWGIQPRCGQLRARNSAPSFRLQSAGQVQPATYSRIATSPWLSELGRQIWGLPDGRIIFASVILCVCARVLVECLGVGARMGMESRHRSAFARAASRSLNPSRGSGHLRAAPPQAPGGVPPPGPYRPRPRGPDARS